MKHTTKLFGLLLILASAVSCNVQEDQNSDQRSRRGNRGQGNFDPETMAKRQVDRISETLELSDDQKDEATQLFTETGKRLIELRKNSDGDRSKIREMMAEINKEREVELKSILTDEQWTKWTEIREQFQEQGRRRRNAN